MGTPGILPLLQGDRTNDLLIDDGYQTVYSGRGVENPIFGQSNLLAGQLQRCATNFWSPENVV
jgi:hypothetical protein